MASKVIHAIYNDDDILLNAVKQVRSEHYHIEEIYTPFPVHGLEKAMGLADTRIAITSFLYGLLGLAVAIIMMNYIMIQDWPQDIGGKPSFSYIENMPAFVPIMFEMTVFFAAHLMVITFYMRSKLWPFKKAENPDVRTTDDHFLMAVDTGNHDVEKMTKFLYNTGALEISLIENDEDDH
ncbi:MAG: DUF3341 domain-containing protein [Bacteroidia bacterium]|nr:DUF3341 domain-containing protein [Bacteroidia bacterium]NNF30537.1 DUF3341 domain-containing protein [Flavobacteriaceae bacterium]MBT8277129.1 DUF3341 domain-containing protein [Bacteroidia bacterium]NNJ81051.1 DUF3341 domain-containing protein [Flavobacteriaceae bacterium]NNK53884.1 DUF3341 domain-containing protein [Flavobacteriaceae bacterium]